MFTGLVEEVGSLKSIRKSASGYVVEIFAKRVLEDVKIGASICTNGVCLSVTGFSDKHFCADVMNETINSSNFKFLKPGDPLNLERALSANGRFDGHVVQGHVDGLGRVISKSSLGNFVLRISADAQLLKYIAKKGSVCLDGISLTVSDISSNYFEVSIIPTTIRDTNLSHIREGYIINIETDILARYVEKFYENKLSFDNLKDWGYYE